VGGKAGRPGPTHNNGDNDGCSQVCHFNIMIEQYAHEIVVLFLFGLGILLFYLGLKDVNAKKD
jgi:hypothetical protein